MEWFQLYKPMIMKQKLSLMKGKSIKLHLFKWIGKQKHLILLRRTRIPKNSFHGVLIFILLRHKILIDHIIVILQEEKRFILKPAKLQLLLLSHMTHGYKAIYQNDKFWNIKRNSKWITQVQKFSHCQNSNFGFCF